MVTNLLSKGIAVCVVAFASTVASASDWGDSPVGRAWNRATGYKLDLKSEAITVDGNMLSVTTPSGDVHAEFVWFPLTTVPVTGSVDDDVTDHGKAISLRQQFWLTDGVVVIGGVQSRWLFISHDQSVTTVDAAGTPVQVSASTVLPIREFRTKEDADEFMAGLESAASGAKGDGGIFCHDPTWVGRNGEECCGFLAAYQAGINSCYSRYWLILSGCLGVGGTAGGTWFWNCSKACVSALVVSAPCMKACLISSALITVGSALVCIGGAEFAFEECCQARLDEYLRDLTNSGCELRKPSYIRTDIGDNQ